MSANQSANPSSDSDECVSRRGEPIGWLSVAQFFFGGLVLFVAAAIIMYRYGFQYDGIVSIIGWLMGVMAALLIAVVSMVAAFLIGLPLRLVPSLRSRWLANGELTLAGAALGLVACFILVAAAPMVRVTDELATSIVRDVNSWALLAAWSMFAVSVAHFVWPRRWTRHAAR